MLRFLVFLLNEVLSCIFRKERCKNWRLFLMEGFELKGRSLIIAWYWWWHGIVICICMGNVIWDITAIVIGLFDFFYWSQFELWLLKMFIWWDFNLWFLKVDFLKFGERTTWQPAVILVLTALHNFICPSHDFVIYLTRFTNLLKIPFIIIMFVSFMFRPQFIVKKINNIFDK